MQAFVFTTQVMDMEPEHWVWKRERPEYHGGALRDYLRHEDDNGNDDVIFYIYQIIVECT